MPTENNTTSLGLAYPTAANNGSNFAQGIEDLANGVDAIIPAALNDILVAGVTSSGAGAVANPAVSSAGVVSCTGLGAGNAYIALSSGVLVRNAIPTGSFSNTPTLPASGKYACVGIDLIATTWDGTASVGLSSKGSDETTAALALANPPSVATGHYRLMNLAIENTSGTYSLAETADTRALAQQSLGVYAGGTAPFKIVWGSIYAGVLTAGTYEFVIATPWANYQAACFAFVENTNYPYDITVNTTAIASPAQTYLYVTNGATGGVYYSWMSIGY